MSIARPSRRRRQHSFIRLLIIAALFASLLPMGIVQTVARQSVNNPGDIALLTNQLEHPMQDEVLYFVLPDRFNDAVPNNNTGGISGSPINHGYLPDHKGYYHGGDIRGIIEQIDYIQGLGVTAIWMAPLFKNRAVQGDGTIPGSSSGYHGYWITDFTDVDPHFGTKEDLHWLVNAAHDHDIKVFFDIITNHTADVIDYAEGSNDYISKQEQPYRDASGQPFDDKDYAGTEAFPPLDPDISFPYTPIFPNPGDATVKEPGWLNDPIYYHNRGNSTFSGENSEYGDFVGLDDLFTEHPVVVDGMIDIYKTWVEEVGIDGFRIDTVKHVNMEFWQEFSPALLDAATGAGNPDFFMFGEVFSGSVPFVSQYVTTGQLPATLDFPFQEHARAFASQSQPTEQLSELFQEDDYYTDADGNAYRLPTFLGNHDMGRIGFFLKQDNPGASDAELLKRDKLAHALSFFARGIPIIYYGDEQGFTGDGGDQDAREDMFPSQVASYNDNDLIGTNATTAQSNFDTGHPLYQTLASYAEVRSEHETLRRGAQIERYSTDEAGIYAFSRITTNENNKQFEYVVAFNNAETAKSATFSTFVPDGRFTPIMGSNRELYADSDGNLTVNVPALSFVIYKATRELPKQMSAPRVKITTPDRNQVVSRRAEVSATVSGDRYAEVTFAVHVEGTEGYQVIGTDANAPYRVFHDVSDLPVGTRLTYKAIANDISDDTRARARRVTSDTSTAVVGETQARMVDVTLNVTVPATTDATGFNVHIAGELNLLDPNLPAWDPTAVSLTQVDATHWTISFSVVEETIVQYKYALESWDYVEKGAACNELNNHILTVSHGESGAQTINDTVVNWRNVAPCGS